MYHVSLLDDDLDDDDSVHDTFLSAADVGVSDSSFDEALL